MKFVSEKHNKNFDPENPPSCDECCDESVKLIKFSIGNTVLLCEDCLNNGIKLINDYTD